MGPQAAMLKGYNNVDVCPFWDNYVHVRAYIRYIFLCWHDNDNTWVDQNVLKLIQYRKMG